MLQLCPVCLEDTIENVALPNFNDCKVLLCRVMNQEQILSQPESAKNIWLHAAREKPTLQSSVRINEIKQCEECLVKRQDQRAALASTCRMVTTVHKSSTSSLSQLPCTHTNQKDCVGSTRLRVACVNCTAGRDSSGIAAFKMDSRASAITYGTKCQILQCASLSSALCQRMSTSHTFW